MIITDYNKMTLEELRSIHENVGVSFIVDNGRISGTEKDNPTQTADE